MKTIIYAFLLLFENEIQEIVAPAAFHRIYIPKILGVFLHCFQCVSADFSPTYTVWINSLCGGINPITMFPVQ